MGTEIWPGRRLRHSVELEARIVRSTGELVSTQVVDLSLDGCKLYAEFGIGERIEVTIQRLGVFVAIVRWSLNGQSGARFLPKVAAGQKHC